MKGHSWISYRCHWPGHEQAHHSHRAKRVSFTWRHFCSLKWWSDYWKTAVRFTSPDGTLPRWIMATLLRPLSLSQIDAWTELVILIDVPDRCRWDILISPPLAISPPCLILAYSCSPGFSCFFEILWAVRLLKTLKTSRNSRCSRPPRLRDNEQLPVEPNTWSRDIQGPSPRWGNASVKPRFKQFLDRGCIVWRWWQSVAACHFHNLQIQ